MHPTLGDYTFIDAIARGWGIAMTCRACGAAQRWSDAVLEERFGRSLDVPVAALTGRLRCPCGGREVAVYYYQANARDTGPSAFIGVAEREAALRAAAGA